MHAASRSTIDEPCRSAPAGMPSSARGQGRSRASSSAGRKRAIRGRTLRTTGHASRPSPRTIPRPPSLQSYPAQNDRVLVDRRHGAHCTSGGYAVPGSYPSATSAAPPCSSRAAIVAGDSVRQRPSEAGADDRLLATAGSPGELEELEDPRRDVDGSRAEIFEPDAQVAVAQSCSSPYRAAARFTQLQSAIDRSGCERSAGNRSRVAVLSQLVLVRGERHVAAVADDVQESQRGEVAVEEAAGGRCCAAPSSPTGARARARRNARGGARRDRRASPRSTSAGQSAGAMREVAR